ncbi:MAG: prepilin peptidase [Candidatus Paceibacterota bacterium]|jgi:leader peptidase (prepilin peptidase)/N-methyltransferase
MNFLNIFIIFILGTIIGSFINVVVLRYNTGLSFAKGRSKCFSCGDTLSWYELVPLFSFIFLGGKCLSCGSKISYQYPVVEFITGLVFSLVFLKTGISIFFPFYLVVFSILVIIAVYDVKHKIIPDGMVFAFSVLSLVVLFLSQNVSNGLILPNIWDLLAGPILASFFAFFWLVSSGRWMGFGDAKLALGVGWLLGIAGGVFAIMLSFWIGAVVSLFIILLEKLNLFKWGITIKSEIPFAPFIILATFIQYFTGWTLVSFILLLS